MKDIEFPLFALTEASFINISMVAQSVPEALIATLPVLSILQSADGADRVTVGYIGVVEFTFWQIDSQTF